MKALCWTAIRLAVVAVFSGGAIEAATTWTSPITNSVTWTRSGSPHQWTGQMFVDGGVVTIEPGAVVQLPADPEPWNDYMALRLRTGGQILAEGSPEDPIRIGGVSDLQRGGTVVLASTAVSVFRHCRFSDLSALRFDAVSPPPEHVFEHCVFRKFSDNVIWLRNMPARIQHCIFQDNAAFGVHLYFDQLHEDNAPTIWHNGFDADGLLISTTDTGDHSLGNHEFFRYNRVAAGVGIKLVPHSSWSGVTIGNLRVVDCDLGGCTNSVRLEGNQFLGAMTITRCDLSTLGGTHASINGVQSYRDNFWGSTDTNVIAGRLFGGTVDPAAAVPLATYSRFPQADVDRSGGATPTTLADADLVKAYLVGATSLSVAQLEAADADRSGTVDVRDVLLIESFARGLVPALPAP